MISSWPSSLTVCATSSSTIPPAKPMVCQRRSPPSIRSCSARAVGSAKTSMASSNLTPCLSRLILAFASSHSNKTTLIRYCNSYFVVTTTYCYFPALPSLYMSNSTAGLQWKQHARNVATPGDAADFPGQSHLHGRQWHEFGRRDLVHPAGHPFGSVTGHADRFTDDPLIAAVALHRRAHRPRRPAPLD